MASVYVRDADSGAVMVAPRECLNFFHQDWCPVPAGMTVLEAYCRMTGKSPRLLRAAFWLRDRISVFAGVRPIHGFASHNKNQVPVAGDSLDFFNVHSISDDELCLTACDRHLSVLVALQLDPPAGENRFLTITASVKTHNVFGKLYMLPVAPAHGVIVRYMLKRLECHT